MGKWLNDLIEALGRPSDILKGERNNFLLQTMALTQYVLQADGKIMHSEMELLRDFLQQCYGEEKKEICLDLLARISQESKKYSALGWDEKIEACAREMKQEMKEEQCRTMLGFLIRVVRIDGSVDVSEVESISKLAVWLGVEAQSAEELDRLISETEGSWTI